jgi:N-acetylmuramoyl-L-alanine amidase
MRLLAVIALFAALAAMPAGASEWPEARTTASAARLGEHPGLTRLVLDVTQLTEFRTLVTDQGRRILVGIPSVDWETNRHRLKPFGLITGFDFMRRGLKRGLLVIRTAAPARIEHQFTLPPDPADNKGNRLVLDLVRADAGAVAMPMPQKKKPSS